MDKDKKAGAQVFDANGLCWRCLLDWADTRYCICKRETVELLTAVYTAMYQNMRHEPIDKSRLSIAVDELERRDEMASRDGHQASQEHVELMKTGNFILAAYTSKIEQDLRAKRKRHHRSKS